MRGQGSESQRGGEERRQDCWCCRHQQRACRVAEASAEKLEHTGTTENERVASVPQREQLPRTPESHLPKGKETKPSVQIVRRKRFKVSEREGSEREYEEKRVNSTVKKLSQVPKRSGRASKKSLPRRSRRKHERVSGRKSSPGRSAKSWFHSKSGQT